MTTCSVRWRPSGGRGEFEFVPANSLLDREIIVDFGPLNIRIPAEVSGVHAQGKPRLRKFDKDNRQKFHLPQLVMAVAGLPEPARSDQSPVVTFPLENKAFVMDAMDFDVVEDDGLSVVLEPLRASILHSNFQIQFGDRFQAIADDLANFDEIDAAYPELAEAVKAHAAEFMKGVNSISIRKTADKIIELKSRIFGFTNAGSVHTLMRVDARPEVDNEELTGREGRLLTRLHVYKERDRTFAKRVKDHYRREYGGKLVCKACGKIPEDKYGQKGEQCIEAHHTVPIEQLQPDSVTHVGEMAIVCANCHRVIHSQKPCLTISDIQDLLVNTGYFPST